MHNITLGQYVPLDSFFHKLDPRCKICAMIAFLVAIFIDAGWIGYGILALIAIVSVLIAKLSFSFIIKALKPSFVMLIFLLIVNCLTLRTGNVLFSIFGFGIYDQAIIQTLYITVRLLLMLIVTTLLTATTKPMDLTLGIEDLLSPLEKIKVPTHDIAMMISLALRFIPTLLNEADRIMKAQASRGVDLENGNIKEKVQAILSLIVPLFVSCFSRADELADAMEARGYVVGSKRVRYKQLKFTYRDVIVLFVMVVIITGLIFISL